MSIPQVVIVGRPNVGKSSLFNWLAGARLAIVDDVAGVTRDRLTHVVAAHERTFELVDTGGIGGQDVDNLTDEIEAQIAVALDQADVVLFVVDTRAGRLPLDETVAARLRQLGRPLLLVANKTDDPKLEPQANEFHRLGCGDVLPVSTLQNRNQEELLAAIVQRLPPPLDVDHELSEATMKVAIVGRQNVGKSTLVNTLAQTERMIVSEIPGTTRDSVDVRFELDGKAFIAIDTPGLRRRMGGRSDLEFYSLHRAQRSIRRADVVLMVFDAAQPVSKVDKQLCSYIAEQFKPCVFVVNKWDLYAGSVATEEWVDYLRAEFPSMKYAPIAFITGQTGKNVKTLLNHAQMLYRMARQRIGTGVLNRLVRQILQHHPPPLHHHRPAKVFYATQVATEPPTLVLVCNQPEAFSASYRRYLLGALRDELSFGEVPIRLFLQTRGQSDRRDDVQDEAVEH